MGKAIVGVTIRPAVKTSGELLAVLAAGHKTVEQGPRQTIPVAFAKQDDAIPFMLRWRAACVDRRTGFVC